MKLPILKSLAALTFATSLLLAAAGCQNADAIGSQPSAVAATTPAPKPAPIIVIALAKVTAGNEAVFKAAATAVIAPSRAEVGNISYDFQQNLADATEFATYEQWDTQAHADAHLKSAHVQTFFKVATPLFAPGFPVLKQYQKLVP